MEAQQEKVFFDERAVKVTNTRFILPGQKTFAMSGVTAVKTSQIDPNRLLPLILLVVGLIVGYNKGVNLISIGLVLAGGAWLYLQKSTYFIVLSTSSGEQQALQDKDLSWISKVVAALNEAIIYRG
ncbi:MULTISPECIES: DUF6232 family protein [Pseudomonas]|jgi:hypothetical protein|uniref:QacE n=1 Tax=Pseudomonas yamanorum TaxID=515393 RepID=A0A7Y8FC69_9PSED|nr:MULTISPECIES: DUF6232 family protein [Pseudomonas]NWD27067.1 hypothetical protein [Pseudomonas yamanorum]NWE76443.1 hypothetical protein [Pseudomonas yamanorum]